MTMRMLVLTLAAMVGWLFLAACADGTVSGLEGDEETTIGEPGEQDVAVGEPEAEPQPDEMDSPVEEDAWDINDNYENGIPEEKALPAIDPGVLVWQDLPWAGVDIAPCAEGADAAASLRASRAVWGDDAGLTYFAGEAFWVLSEHGGDEVLTCDARMTLPVFSMDGRATPEGNELWTGHQGRIGRLSHGRWHLFNLPPEMLSGNDLSDNDRVVDIDIAGDKVAVLTKTKLGFFSRTTGHWLVARRYPDGLNRVYGLAYDGQTLWATAGLALYTVDLNTAGFAEAAISVRNYSDEDIARKGPEAGITGADKDGVWLTVYGADSNHVVRYDRQRMKLLSQDFTDEGGCSAFVFSFLPPWSSRAWFRPCLSQSPGMGGWPLLLYRFTYGVYQDYSSFFAATMAAWDYHLELSAPGASLWARAGNILICKTNAESPWGCYGWLFHNTDARLRQARAWRGAAQMWHLDGAPRRYRWAPVETTPPGR